MGAAGGMVEGRNKGRRRRLMRQSVAASALNESAKGENIHCRHSRDSESRTESYVSLKVPETALINTCRWQTQTRPSSETPGLAARHGASTPSSTAAPCSAGCSPASASPSSHSPPTSSSTTTGPSNTPNCTLLSSRSYCDTREIQSADYPHEYR